jgi:hypothetical protein
LPSRCGPRDTRAPPAPRRDPRAAPAQDTDVEREVRTRRGGSHIASVQMWRLLLVLLAGLTMGALSVLVNWRPPR